MQVPIDHVFDGADFIKLPLEIISKALLIPKLTSDVTFLMGRLFELRQHKIEPLHQTLLILFQHHDLVLVLLMRLIELAIVLEVRSVVFNRL